MKIATEIPSLQNYQRAQRYAMPAIPVNQDSMPPQKKSRTEDPSLLDMFEFSSESDFDGYDERIGLILNCHMILVRRFYFRWLKIKHN